MRNTARVMSLDPCIKFQEVHYNIPLYRWDHWGSGREETCPASHFPVCARADLPALPATVLSCLLCAHDTDEDAKAYQVWQPAQRPIIDSCRMRICAWVRFYLRALLSLPAWVGALRNRDSLLPDVSVLHEESKETESSYRAVCALKWARWQTSHYVYLTAIKTF